MLNKNDKAIVITGAAGFIGSALVRYLNDNSINNLILVDDLKNLKWKNLVGKNFIDIIEKEKAIDFLSSYKNGISTIFHLGACSSTICTDENFLLENNYRYSQKICKFAITNNIKFIYASSAATYGDGSQGFEDNEDKLEILRPINMYAYSKQLFDLWVKKNNLLKKVVGLKYFNVFGPNEYHKGPMASMILKMLSKIKNEKKIDLFKSTDFKNYKDGMQKRDFIYIKDAVLMTTLFLKEENKDVFGIFNIGTGIATTWNYLAKALFEALNIEENINYIDMPKEMEKQYQNYTKADMTKFNKFFRNQYKITDIKKAVKDYVQNYLLIDKRW